MKKLGKIESIIELKKKANRLDRENLDPTVDAILDVINYSKRYKEYKITIKIEGK